MIFGGRQDLKEAVKARPTGAHSKAKSARAADARKATEPQRRFWLRLAARVRYTGCRLAGQLILCDIEVTSRIPDLTADLRGDDRLK